MPPFPHACNTHLFNAQKLHGISNPSPDSSRAPNAPHAHAMSSLRDATNRNDEANDETSSLDRACADGGARGVNRVVTVVAASQSDSDSDGDIVSESAYSEDDGDDGRGTITAMIIDARRGDGGGARGFATTTEGGDDVVGVRGVAVDKAPASGTRGRASSVPGTAARRRAVATFIDDAHGNGEEDEDEDEDEEDEDDLAFIDDDARFLSSDAPVLDVGARASSRDKDDDDIDEDCIKSYYAHRRREEAMDEGGRRRETEDGFEISDGEVSIHSESSQDRTRGVKSFNVRDVANAQFGKGKRGLVRRTVDGKSVMEVLREGPAISDNDDDDESPIDPSEHVALSPNKADSPIIIRDDMSPLRRRPMLGYQAQERGTLGLAAVLGKRTRTFGEINARSLEQVTQPQITTVFTKACAPWKFNYRVFGTDPPSSRVLDAALLATTSDEPGARECRAVAEDANREGKRVLSMAMDDYMKHNSSGRIGIASRTTSKGLSLDAVSNWRHAMELLSRGDGFWTAVKDCLEALVIDERRSASVLMHNSTKTMTNRRQAQAFETAWELLFVAAKVWYEEGYQTEHAAHSDWAARAWNVIVWLVDSCPLAQYPIDPLSKTPNEFENPPTSFNMDDYTRAVCERVAELVTWWPRCAVDQHPIRILWRRIHGADVNVENTKITWSPQLKASSSCCRACMPLAWRPFEERFEATRATFVSGSACEVLHRALGEHLSKCSIETKIMRRELGKWLGDARLSAAKENTAVNNVHGEGFIAIGGFTLPLTPSLVRLKHRASVHVELFRVCIGRILHDQAVLCLKQIMSSVTTQRTSIEDPAARCVLLRALTTCLGIWLQYAAMHGNSGHKCADDILRVMRALSDMQKMTGVPSASIIGSAFALNEGAVVAEAAAAWVAAFNVLVVTEPDRRVEALDMLYPLDKHAFSRDWRERVFVTRTVASLCAPGSFAEKYGLLDTRPALMSWLAFAIDTVAGGVAPLAAALCARSEFLVLSQAATSSSTVGWCQSKAGAAVAAALRGKHKHKTESGGETHVSVVGNHPGALLTSKESAFRVAVATLVAKEIANTMHSTPSSTQQKLDLEVMATIMRKLPPRANRLFKEASESRTADISGGASLSAKSSVDEGASATRLAHASVVSGVVKSLVAHCSTMLARADVECNGKSALAFPAFMPFPPAHASSWGVAQPNGRTSYIGHVVAPLFENDAVELVQQQVRAIDALRYTYADDDDQRRELVLQELSAVTCGVLEAMTGAQAWASRELALANAIARAISRQSGSDNVVLKQYLPHFVLSALQAPQKCGARRIMTAVKVLSIIVSLRDTDAQKPASVLNVMALPLIVVAHESMVGELYEHHAATAVASVLTDVLVPLLKDALGDRGAGSTMSTSTAASDATGQQSSTSMSASSAATKSSASARGRTTMEVTVATPRPYFPFPGARPATVATLTATNTTPAPAPVVHQAPIAQPESTTSISTLKAEALRALSTNAVWRIICAHVSVSVAILTRVALEAPVNSEIVASSSFQVIVGKKTAALNESPRLAEITRLRQLLRGAQKATKSALAIERKEVERLMSDALKPLPESFRQNGVDAAIRWGLATSLAPNAFVVEEDAQERTRRLVFAAVQFLTHVSKLQGNGFAEVSKHAASIQAAAAFLLEPSRRAAGTSSNTATDVALKALLQTLDVRIMELPPKQTAPSSRPGRRR